MSKLTISTKRLMVEKANSTIVAIVAIAVFIAVFSLFAASSLWSKQSYQARVIAEKEKARDQLKANLEARDQLVTSYRAFVDSQPNVLGGNAAGDGERDGDNAKLILDALPSKYDYPGLVSSLEKTLTSRSFQLRSIGGSDDQLNQQTTPDSIDPQVVDMPFTLSTDGTYESSSELISVLERSIRPMRIRKLSMQGIDANLQVDVDAKTYYQPEKSLKLEMKVVE